MDVHRALVAGDHLGAEGRKLDRLRVAIHGNFDLMFERFELRPDLKSTPTKQYVACRHFDIRAVEQERALYQDEVESRQTPIQKHHLSFRNHNAVRAILVVDP